MTKVDWSQLQQIFRALTSPRLLDDVSLELLRTASECLGAPSSGNHAESLAAAVQSLGSFWRSRHLPPVMDPGFKNEWNIFLALEVGYFYPLRKAKPLPANPGRIGVLLSDRDHLATVLADGDARLAEEYASDKYDRFWRAILPQEYTLPYWTVRTRIERGLKLLASDLNQGETFLQAPPPLSEHEKAGAPEISIPIVEQPVSAIRNRFDTASASCPPIAIANGWKDLIQQVLVHRRILLYGRTRIGGTEFLSFLISELKSARMIPVLIDLPEYALYAHKESLLPFCARTRLLCSAFPDAMANTDLEAELAEANFHDRLVVLADGLDDLPDHKMPTVLGRLASIKRVVLATRTPGIFLADMAAIPAPPLG
jgi:hypothetical protein